MSAFGKAASGVPTAVVVLFQNGISLLLLLPWALRHGIGELRTTTRLPLHVVRAISGLLSQALFFLAVKNMALVDAVLLVNAAPLFIPFVALIWMKLRASRRSSATGLVIGFVGVLLILRPSSALLAEPGRPSGHRAQRFARPSPWSRSTGCRQPTSRTRSSSTIFSSRPSPHLHLPSMLGGCRPESSGAISPASASSWRLAQLFIILAYQRATAERLAPFNYSVVVFSGLIGWLVWGNVPGSARLPSASSWSALAASSPSSSAAIVGKGHPIGHGHWTTSGERQPA